MASTIAENGVVEAVTLLSVNPCVITQIKTLEIDGYSALQLGSEKQKRVSKPQTGHFKPSKTTPKLVHEFRMKETDEDANVGESFSADVFSVGDFVDVVGTSKGKGFAGTIKRHNFHRGRKTHGGRSYRRPGSIGSMYPQKIFKGKKMAGQMGAEQVTIQKLKVTYIDTGMGIIGIKGAVPGPRKGIVLIRESA